MELATTERLTTPSIYLVESADSQALYSSHCLSLHPACDSTLLSLFNHKRGSKQIIHYLTPTLRLSHQAKFHFINTPPFAPSSGMNHLDTELQNAVGAYPPSLALKPQALPYPWFSAFKQTLFKASHFHQDFVDQVRSTFHMPCCVVIAISAMVEGDVLQRARDLLAECGNVHPLLPRIFVLVSTSDIEGDDEAELQRVRQEFQDTILVSLANERAFDLSFQLLHERIIKLLSNRTFTLNETVAQHKKGLGNTLRSFFSSTPASSSKHSNDSVTSKTRQLADLLFALRDFDGALHTYAYLKDDYSKDSADLLRLGNAFEMMALCLIALQQQPEKRNDMLERAIDCYIKSCATTQASTTTNNKKQVPLGYRLATNASLHLLDSAPNAIRNNIRVLRRIMMVESEICSAVLLEQIALLMQTPQVRMRRKSSFDLLRAASLFRSLGLNSHAFRCYSQIYTQDIPRGSAWFAAEHHLQLNLGYLARNLKDQQRLIELRGALLERGIQVTNNPASQHTFLLKEYLDALDTAAGIVVKHQLPRIDEVSTAHTVFAQEQAVVKLKLTNPLFCALPVFSMQIYGDEDDSIVCDEVNCVLQAKEERKEVEIRFVPQCEGEIVIRALRWKIGEQCAGVFQHVLLPELRIRVHGKQACLQATVLPFPQGRFQLELRNVGAMDLDAGRLLVSCSDPGALQLGGANAAVEVVNETTVGVAHAALRVGESLNLQCKLFNAVRTCEIAYGKRTLVVDLPAVQQVESPKVQARFVFTARRERLLVVDITSQFPLLPTVVACFSGSVKRVLTSSSPGAAEWNQFAKTWQLVFRLEDGGMEHSSIVQLGGKIRTEPLSPQDDFRFRYYHLKQVCEEANAAKRQYELLRTEMERKGQFPVTIQDVRRAREANPQLFGALSGSVAGTPQPAHSAGSAEAILFETKDFIHLAVDWIRSGSEEGDRTYCCRIPVPAAGLKLAMKLPSQGEAMAQLELLPEQASCSLNVTVKVENTSNVAMHNLTLCIGADTPGFLDHFPRPEFWLGETRRVWREFAAGEQSEITVSAVFVGAGVYLLGPITAQYDGSDPQIKLEDERFVVVTRVDSKEEIDVFTRVQQELNDNSFT